MSTATQPLKYLWTGFFEDGSQLVQPEDDKYSKHDDTAEHNPSAFRDLLEKIDESPLIYFDINDGIFAYGVDLPSGRFGINGTWFNLEDPNIPLSDRKLIYYRVTDRDYIYEENGDITEGETKIVSYAFGYEGTDREGTKHKKVIFING